MGEIQVKRQEIHQNAEPETLAGIALHQLRDRDWRAKNLRPEEGIVCVGVEAGKELGDIRIVVQYEVHYNESDTKRFDRCMRGHNLYLEETAKALQEILSMFEANFVVEIDAFPCPDSGLAVELPHAVAALQGNACDTANTPIPIDNPSANQNEHDNRNG